MRDSVLAKYADLNILQRMQDSYASLTGISIITFDGDGNEVTKWSNPNAFCKEFVRKSEKGARLCHQCELYDAKEALERGYTSGCYCHMGLMQFSAPIVLEGSIIGTIVGKGTAARKFSEIEIARRSADLGIDPDKLWKASKDLKKIERKNVDSYSNFLFMLGKIVSNMVYSKYIADRAGQELERAAAMKSDFLANMSHEIRTPMNAVIGMAEMTLRGNLSNVARDYVTQIKSSGKALLNIINDVLDYSKIESGKLSILPEGYEIASLLNDVSTIIQSRLMDKPVELLLDINPKLPRNLSGDCQRFRQILINLANNAVKFTNYGHVKLVVDFDWISEEKNEILLKVSVKDSGIGIKKEDIDKLFGAFSQVDTKKNRAIEGTGLGLSIVKQLLNLMGGTIKVESEYGKGSTFTFTLPQKVENPEPFIIIKDSKSCAILGVFDNEDVKKEFLKETAKLGVETKILSVGENPIATVDALADENPDKEIYVMVEQSLFSRDTMKSVDVQHSRYNRMHTVLLADAFADVREWNDLSDLKIIKKPVSVMNIATLVNNQDMVSYVPVEQKKDTAFRAPLASVLLVDDNEINLTVAEGLLEPLDMKVDKALSGKDALALLDKNHYDIIFMDHMMPEMDGVETTRIIRRLYPQCNDTAIIALTANAISGAKEMFLDEGMNDFVAKPIEVKLLLSKVREWLPLEKIEIVLNDDEVVTREDNEKIEVGDLDTLAAIKLLGSKKLFFNILKEYFRKIKIKADLIEKCVSEEKWAAYTIEVHALKSSSKQIGAMELSAMAADLEKAGNAREIEYIRQKTPDMLLTYRAYYEVLEPYCVEKTETVHKKKHDAKAIGEILNKLYAAMEELDLDATEMNTERLAEYELSKQEEDIYNRLKLSVADIDMEAIEKELIEWDALL